jgi:hypothetical protein
MPFTASHVLAVVPGVHWHRRLRLDPTCLVIGSMSPDFEYFARGEQVSGFSHTLVGWFLWCVPATLALAALYRFVVKWPVLVAAPKMTGLFADPAPKFGSLGAMASLILSSLLGAGTHLVWDGITHANTLFTRWWPGLEDGYIVIVLGETALHRVLQHASTVVGLIGVVAYVAYRVRAAPDPGFRVPSRTVWRARGMFAVGQVVGVGLLLVRLDRMHVDDPGSLISGVISGWLAGTLVVSLLLQGAGRQLRDGVRLSDTGS